MYVQSTSMNYDKKYDLFYCFNAKTGVTNWKTLASAIHRNMTIKSLQKIIERDKINIYADLPSLKELFHNDSTFLPKPQLGVLLVRHPLIRLYSAWSHRLSNSNKKHKTVFKNQIKLINNKFKM